MFSSTPAGDAALNLGFSEQVMLLLSGYASGSSLIQVLWARAEAHQSVYAAEIPARQVNLTHYPSPLDGTGWLAQGDFESWPDTRLRDLVSNYIRSIASFTELSFSM